VVSGRPEGYSAVARGSDRKRIIRIGSALALFSVCHDSNGPVPVNSGIQSKPQGLTARRTRSRFEDEVWGGTLTRRSQASEPGAEEEDAVKYGAHILPIDWIIGGL
jgi:hypothetical protein